MQLTMLVYNSNNYGLWMFQWHWKKVKLMGFIHKFITKGPHMVVYPQDLHIFYMLDFCLSRCGYTTSVFDVQDIAPKNQYEASEPLISIWISGALSGHMTGWFLQKQLGNVGNFIIPSDWLRWAVETKSRNLIPLNPGWFMGIPLLDYDIIHNIWRVV